jgi:hypothetical protein
MPRNITHTRCRGICLLCFLWWPSGIPGSGQAAIVTQNARHLYAITSQNECTFFFLTGCSPYGTSHSPLWLLPWAVDIGVTVPQTSGFISVQPWSSWKTNKKKHSPCPKSACELYRPSDLRLLKLVSTSAAEDVAWSAWRIPTAYSRFSRPLLFLPNISSIVFTRVSKPRSRPTTSQKVW